MKEEVIEIKEEHIPIRKLKASDLPLMIKILKKIGINKFSQCLKNPEIQELIDKVKDNENDKTAALIGGGVALEIAQIILEGLDGSFEDVYTLLSNISGLKKEEIEDLDLVTFTNLIVDTVQLEGNWDFIKAASKLFNTKN